MRKIAPLFLVCFILACASKTESISRFLVDRKTTQEEVRAKFGQPATIDAKGGRAIWFYIYDEEPPERLLAVFFDQQGVLARHWFAVKSNGIWDPVPPRKWREMK